MDAVRRYGLTTVALFVAALGHALSTWPLPEVLALFGGGAALAFVLEAIVVAAGLLRHEMRPQVLGVPVVVVAAWPTVVYVAYRLALLALPAGVPAAAGAAALATVLDALTEPNALASGVWSYPDHPLSSPRVGGAPWWNFVGWLVIVFATGLLPSLV